MLYLNGSSRQVQAGLHQNNDANEPRGPAHSATCIVMGTRGQGAQALEFLCDRINQIVTGYSR